jgi:hypothetical protein
VIIAAANPAVSVAIHARATVPVVGAEVEAESAELVISVSFEPIRDDVPSSVESRGSDADLIRRYPALICFTRGSILGWIVRRRAEHPEIIGQNRKAQAGIHG